MKQLLLPANATFNASAKTITFATTIPATISHILHVTNVTRGVLYFQPQAGAAFTGTLAGAVLTLACSTSGHADADKLEIFYDDSLTTMGVTGPLTDTQLRAAAIPVSVVGIATETTQAAQSTLMGSLTETAPTTDIASSGLNGRLQRIAQRLTSLITALGSPFQAGGLIGNTGFNVTGTLPAFATTPTVNTGLSQPLTDTQLRAAAIPVSANAKIVDCSFTRSGSGLSSDEAVQIGATGSGFTVAQSFSNLTVDTGTTANAEFLMRSVDSIKGGHIARIKATLSQKIFNQHFAFYLADLIATGAAFTTNATGLLISVTLPNGHGFTSLNIGQSVYLGGGAGAALIVPGRYAITAVSGNVVTLSPVFQATWTRSTTTATVTFLGGNPIYSLNETATVSASSDVAAIVNSGVTLLTQASGGITTFTCLNAGATSGTLTLTMSAKAWTPSASGTITVFGWNAISAVKNGTSATVTWFDSQRKGWASGASTVTTTTDAGVGQLIQLSGDTTSEYLADGSPVTVATLQMVSRASRMESLVDANTPLYLFVQAFNGVTAPASTTRLTIGKFSLEETGINKVHIAGVSQTGSGNGQRVTVDAGVLTTVTTVAAVTASGTAAATRNTDQASGAITTTATSTTIVPALGCSYVYDYNITAVSGTLPTLDVVIQESTDGVPTNWFDRYHFPRATAAGVMRSPPLQLGGGSIRYVQTIAGTTPSFTRVINRQQSSLQAQALFQYFDRTAGLLNGTLNATSAVYVIDGCATLNARVVLGATTTPGTYQIQVSDDGVNFTRVGTATAAVASAGTNLIVTGVIARFAQVVCTSAGTTQVGTYVSLVAKE